MLTAILSTLAAWLVGLVIDANLFQPTGFLCLRVVLPVIVMGAFILAAVKKQGRPDGENENLEKGNRE